MDSRPFGWAWILSKFGDEITAGGPKSHGIQVLQGGACRVRLADAPVACALDEPQGGLPEQLPVPRMPKMLIELDRLYLALSNGPSLTHAGRSFRLEEVPLFSGKRGLFEALSARRYGHLIDVEVDMYASGSARDSRMVGMPDVAVRESRERIKSALLNTGFGYPNKTLTINLAPANVRKEGAGFDLPVALGILGAMGMVKGLDRHLSVGELSLDGTIRPIRGARSVAVCARASRIPNLILPVDKPPKPPW